MRELTASLPNSFPIPCGQDEARVRSAELAKSTAEIRFSDPPHLNAPSTNSMVARHSSRSCDIAWAQEHHPRQGLRQRWPCYSVQNWPENPLFRRGGHSAIRSVDGDPAALARD